MQRYWKERAAKSSGSRKGAISGNDNFASIKASWMPAPTRSTCRATMAMASRAREDRCHRQGLEFIRQNGVPAGVGGHEIRTMQLIEKAGIAPDFM